MDAHEGIHESGEFSNGKVVERQDVALLVRDFQQDSRLVKLRAVCEQRMVAQGEISAFSLAMSKNQYEEAKRCLDETTDGWTTVNFPNDHRVGLEEARRLVQHFSGSGVKNLSRNYWSTNASR